MFKKLLAMCMALLLAYPTVFAAENTKAADTNNDQISVTANNEVPIGDTDIKLPAVDGIENIFENGDFEEVEGNKASGWTAGRGEWGAMAEIVNDKKGAPSGSNYFRLDASKVSENMDSPFISQGLKTAGRAIYQFECYVKAEEKTNAAIKLEFYPDFSIPGASGSVGETNPLQIWGGDGKWQHVLFNFRAPLTAFSGSILLRAYGRKGVVCYDKITVRMVQGPPMVNISLDEVFVYSDKTGENNANITFMEEYYPELCEDVTIDFAVKDGKTVLTEKKGIPYAGKEMKCSFDVSVLKEKKKEYTVQVDVKDKAGKLIYTVSTPVYKYDRPTLLGADGVFREADGTVFYPVVGYHVDSSQTSLEKTLEKCVEAGITVVQCGASQLDILEQSGTGIKGFVPLYGNMEPAGHDTNAEKTKTIVEKYKNHPSLFAWGTMDEPFLNCGDPEDDLRKSYKIIRDIDDAHPVYICECMQTFHETSAKYVDILGIDPYPIRGMDSSMVRERAEHAVAHAAGKPILTVNMTYNSGYYMPSAGDIRHINYQTFIGGSTMLGYYSIADPASENGAAIPLWNVEHEKISDAYNGLLDFTAKEQHVLFEHFYEKKTVPFTKYQSDDFTYYGFVKDGSVYLMLMNNKAEAQTVTAELTSYDGSVRVEQSTVELVSATGAKVGKRLGSSAFTVNMQGFEASLYCFTPIKKLNFSTLSWEAFKTYQPEEKAYFTDLSDYSWASEQIEKLYKDGIVNQKGDGVYLPGKEITRGEFAMFLVRTLGLESDSTENFDDVDASAEYARDIAIGKAHGILNGIGDNKYNPEACVTRQDLMTIIARGMNLSGKEAELEAFTDADKIADYARGCVAAMIASGLVQGNGDGTVNPLGNATRAEAAVIMSRILETEGK